MYLVVTDSNWKDLGMVEDFTLDLAFGIEENDFTLDIDADIEPKSLVYIDGTEYGGIISDQSSTVVKKRGRETDERSYTGTTWHGMMEEKILRPDSGQDYLTVYGEANSVLQSLIGRMRLNDLFTASTANSGIQINYQFERYVAGYTGIRAMLKSSAARLKMVYKSGFVELSAVPVVDYTDDINSELIQFDIEKSFRPVNHLVCLGEGELRNRTVVDLYADANGNVSKVQSLFGVDEVSAVYDYTNADAAELEEKGTEKLQDLQGDGTVSVTVTPTTDYAVGDIISAKNYKYGIFVEAEVTKKIIAIEKGVLKVEYEVGAKSESDTSLSGSSESSGGGGGGGVSYEAGNGITIVGLTINADVNEEDLQEVQELAQEAKTQASNASVTAGAAQTAANSAASAAATAQQTADGKADAVHTHAAADTTSGVFDLARIPTIPASKLSGTLDIAGGGTGANNAADAANNLAVYYLGVREPIPTNADLNNYKTVGSYASPSNSMAATVINAPVDAPRAFILTVEKTIANENTANYFRQIFHDRTGKIYTRFIEGDTWSDWIKIANETDLDNYLPLTGGTLTGNVNTASVNIGSYESYTERLLSVRRGFSLNTDNPIRVQAMVNVASNMALFSFRNSSNNVKNCLYLYEDRSVLAKPLTVSSGGTGANTAEQARENLGAAPEDHTHNYAGSSSVGGAANSAKKLDTPRTITLTGAVNGSAAFDGSENITIVTTGDSASAQFLAAWPVGSIFPTSDSNPPSVGTWEKLPSIDGFKYLRVQ